MVVHADHGKPQDDPDPSSFTWAREGLDRDLVEVCPEPDISAAFPECPRCCAQLLQSYARPVQGS